MYDVAHKNDAFKMLRKFTGVTSLAIRFRNTLRYPNSYSESDFVAEFGVTLLPQITELIVYPSNGFCYPANVFENLKEILHCSTSIEKLLVALPTSIWKTDTPPMEVDNVLTKTVGSQLKELRFGAQEEEVDTVGFDYPVGPSFVFGYPSIPDLGRKEDWPFLKVVEFGRLWSRLGDGMDRIKLLLSIWRATVRHGGWVAKFREPLELELYELSHIAPGEAHAFLSWIKQHKGPETDDLVIGMDTHNFIIEGLEGTTRNRVATSVVELFGNELALKITGDFPPTAEPYLMPILDKITPYIKRLTVDPEQVLNNEYVIDISDAQYAFVQWSEFLKMFLPKCTNMETLRIRSDSTGKGGDIPLAKYDSEIATLCRDHKLRYLDVDASALTQPETNASTDMEFSKCAQEPYLAIQHLMWISLPDSRSGWNSFRNNLLTLHHLTLHGIFLHRQTEFIWFTNITSKLKNLEKLEVHGLVWHTGYSKELAWEEDEEWEDENEEDNYVPPDPIDDEGREQPVDDGERQNNREMANFFLNDFDAAMRKQLGLTEDNCMQSSEYRMMIASRDAMRGELERRGEDGTIKRQPSPYIHGHPIPRPPPQQQEQEQDEVVYVNDVESTDSGFGVDPRVAEPVDEELRSQRLGEWVERLLIATARRTGGRCRDVVIKDMVVSAKGKKPWWFRERGKEEKRWVDSVMEEGEMDWGGTF